MKPSLPILRYPKPRSLDQAGLRVHHDQASAALWVSEGLLAGNAYRELATGDASQGTVGFRQIRAVKPFAAATGLHWHDMDLHVVYVLKGHIDYRFAGEEQTYRVVAGDCITQPAGVPHEVIGHSDDMELLEITSPQRYATVDL